MKRIRLHIMALLLLPMGAMQASAQVSLGNVLSKVSSAASKVSSASAGDVVSNITSVFSASKTAKVSDLVGTWSYEEPAVVFQSSNILKSAGGKLASSAIEKKLQSQLDKYGFKKGKMKMTFDNKGNFTQTIGGKSLKGTYTVSGKNVVLKYGGTTQQILGTTQVVDGDLLIVMNATKLLGYMKTLGSLSGSSSLQAATSLLGSMDGMECGMRLTK